MPNKRLTALQNRPLRRLRQLDGNKIFFGIEVVFAGLIDYAQLAVLGSLRIGEKAVDFARLQGCSVTLVLHAENKTRRPGFRINQ